MKAKLLILTFLLVICFSINAQIDYKTLLIGINYLIYNDLLEEDSIVIAHSSLITYKDSYIFGDSYVFWYHINSKDSILLSFVNRPNDSLLRIEKNKKKLCKEISFYHHVVKSLKDTNQVNSDYFYYKFMLLPRKGDSFKCVIFGEYKFQFINNEFTIVDKKKKFLTDEDEIMKEYMSDW